MRGRRVTGSPWTDLDRPPLRQAELERALVRPGGLWRSIDVVAETGSTNADMAERARAGAPEGTVLTAELQVSGRGRLDRTWFAPARSGLAVSVLLRPEGVPASRMGWIPLLTGVAAATAVRRHAEVEARLKWPNDVLIGERKLAGILAEMVDGAVVVGIGLNVTLRSSELPVPTATSLLLEDAVSTDRDPLLRLLLRELAEVYQRWRDFDGDAGASGLRGAYRELCATLGRRVRVQLPGRETVAGEAVDVDETGRLVIQTPEGEDIAVNAGDIIHVR
ncbi:MAG: biotin--[acetyl-CoA-carboxylase] ligase [Streptosporangiales bacterium]|nr:biotin--[acetyl-CoA-carboxylase] ligase [Streptosporangiales bacterium]